MSGGMARPVRSQCARPRGGVQRAHGTASRGSGNLVIQMVFILKPTNPKQPFNPFGTDSYIGCQGVEVFIPTNCKVN